LNFATIAKPLTDLTIKRYRNSIPWGKTQQQAYDSLRLSLEKATEEPLYTVDFEKPFNLFVDASSETVASALSQTGPDGNEVPIAFSSTKLNKPSPSGQQLRKKHIQLLRHSKKQNVVIVE